MRSYLLIILLPFLLLTCGPAPEDAIPPDVPALSTLPLIPLPAEISDGDEVSYYKTYKGEMTPSSDPVVGDARRYLGERMPDVARHFFTVEEVEQIIDRIAAYKTNPTCNCT